MSESKQQQTQEEPPSAGGPTSDVEPEPWRMTREALTAAWRRANSAVEHARMMASDWQWSRPSQVSGRTLEAKTLAFNLELGRRQKALAAATERATALSPFKHRGAIERALAEGKPVPPEVLAEYPDLAGWLVRHPNAITIGPSTRDWKE